MDTKLTPEFGRLSGWLTAALVMLATARTYPQSPWAATQAAGPVGPAVATLHGMATARSAPAAAWFEWGTDTTYGSVTTLTNIGSSGRVVRVSASVNGLTPGATYHYRLVATNAIGPALGADAVFTTGLKVATWTDQSVPNPAIPSGLTNIVGQACGHGHSLAITSDGAVVAWGVGIPTFYSNYGQTNVPAGLSNVVAVAAGWAHSLALRQDGTVIAWGEYMSPLQAAFVPAGLSNVVAVAGGDSHSLALKSDGTVAAWGGNGSGQISVPATLSNVVAITAGSTHSLALKADGTVVAWGSEPFGQPTTPPSWLSNVVAISSETWHNLALRSDGTVVAWGNNNFGQTNVPAGLSNVLAIAAGYQHSLALERDGTLVAWGNPRYVTNVPPVLGQVAAISSGDYHSLALSPVNLPPRVFSRTATGPLNSDLIVTLAGWDPNGDVLGFRIASLPTNGTLYQYTGSGRGDPITSPDSSLTDPLKLVFSPSPDSFGAPYTTFSYVASDGQYDSPPGLVTVNILPPPVIGAAGFVPSGTPGFALNFDGLSNASYAVFLCGLGLNQSGKLESAEPSHSTLARPILLFGYRRDKSAFPVLSHHLTMNTPYPRLALGAHIQFVTNGILIVVMAVLLLTLPHQVGPKSSGVMLLAAWLTWTMALSEAANAWWGTTQMLPIAAGQAGATGGTAWHELVVKLTHIAAGVGLVAAWGLLVIGFLKRPTEAGGSNKQAQPLLHRDR